MKMKKNFKLCMAVMVMAFAFFMTSVTTNAMEATYIPLTVNDLTVNPGQNIYTVTVQPQSFVVVPIVMPAKGGMELAMSGDIDIDNNYVYSGYLYADAACTIPTQEYIGSIKREPEIHNIKSQTATIYYLKLENKWSDYALKVNMLGYFYNGDNKTISSGKTYVTYQNDYNTYVYHKFKASKTGYVSFSAICKGTYSSIDVKLLNSKKKSISNVIDVDKYNNYTIGFGVEKGKTYYIATKSFHNGDVYNLKYKLTSVKEKSGSKQSKAVTIKKNKTIKGIQIANNKKSGNDWYKFKLTKSQKIKFDIIGRSTGRIYIKLIPASKNIRIIGGSTMTVQENAKGKYQTRNKFPRGTYYLQVYKLDKKASGYYSIKWK